MQKLEALEAELLRISQSHKALSVSLDECDEILQKEQNGKEQNIQNIVEKVVGEHRIFDPKQPQKYIVENTKIIKISFNPKTAISDISKHGKVRIINDPFINFPVITLADPIKKENSQQCNAYNVCLQFESTIIPKIGNLTIGYMEIVSGSDDEKDVNEQWKTAKYEQIQSEDNKHTVDITDALEFESTYKYFVGLKVNEPIKMRIASNIVEIKEKKPMFWHKINWTQTQKSLENMFNFSKMKKALEAEETIFKH